MKATARMAKVDFSVMQRLKWKVGEHGEAFHDERVKGLTVRALEGDERHGFVHDKSQPQWEAELIDPASKFVVSHVQGRRDEVLIRQQAADGASRLANRHQLVLLSNGDASYATLFPEIFGQAYRPARHGERGRFPAVRYASRARWRTFRSSSIVKAAAWSASTSVMPMAPAYSFTIQCPIPPPSSAAMAPLVA